MADDESSLNNSSKKGKGLMLHSQFPQTNENADAFQGILVRNPIFSFVFGMGSIERRGSSHSESESEGGTPEASALRQNNVPEVPQKTTEEAVAHAQRDGNVDTKELTVHVEPKLEEIHKDDKAKDGNGNGNAAMVDKYTGNGENNRNESENENDNAKNNENANENGLRNGNDNDKDNENELYNDEDDVDDLDYLNEDDYDDYEAYGEDEEQDVEEEEDYEDDYNTNYNHDGDDDDDENIENEEQNNEDEIFWNDQNEYNAFHQQHIYENGPYYNNMENPDDEENWDLEDESIIATQPDYIYPYTYTDSSGYPTWHENGHPVIDLTVDNHGNNINNNHNSIINNNNNRSNSSNNHYHHTTNDESEYNIMDFYNENDFDLVYFNRDADDSDADGTTSHHQYRNGMTIEEMAKYMT